MNRLALAAVLLALALAAGLLLSRTATPARPFARFSALSPGRTVPAARHALISARSTVARSNRSGSTRKVLHAPFGGTPGALGRRLDPESVPVGPMSLVAGARGELWVLDQVNRRLQPFGTDGRPLAPLPLPDATGQDLAISAAGTLAVLDRLGSRTVQRLDVDGRAAAALPLAGPGVADPGGTTGLFFDPAGDLYVEVEHGPLYRLANSDGTPDPERTKAPGRPLRDGSGFVAAAIADRQAGGVLVRAFDPESRLRWQRSLDLGAPILFVALLDSDAAGRVVLGAHVGHESPRPPYSITDEALVLVRLSKEGEPAGAATLPAPPPAVESFRDLTVADDGTIYWMRPTSTGVDIEAIDL